jgi:hypothetical protein
VLGYLLKHAHLALEHRAQAALADVGVTVRDLGVLRVIASGEAQSQQEAAAVLGVDRTSMVALLDALEDRAQRERPPLSRRPVKSSSRSGRSRTPKACRRTALPPATKYRSTIQRGSASDRRVSWFRPREADRGFILGM